ncbi:MAG: glycosyltransferase family 39 protein [Anaerolineae bacterium]|nr:glycosyltransferase family 39 protein [Anaerolineae bacterium]
MKLRTILKHDLSILIILALARLVLHTATNGAYGLHRDELAMLDDARHLAWGYVAYPPLVPILTRVSWEVFGAWLPGLRLLSVIVQCVAMVLVGLMAKELGGGRGAQVVAALAAAIAPMSLVMGTMFQYISFDYFWWVLIGYFIIKRITSGDPRWWIGIGAAIGLGMMTKYTIIFLIAGVIVAVLLTPLRQDLKSRWLYAGAGLSIMIFLPTLIWHIQSDFIALEFTSSIHARDVAIGRADGFIWQQFVASSNPFTVPLWIAGIGGGFSEERRSFASLSGETAEQVPTFRIEQNVITARSAGCSSFRRCCWQSHRGGFIIWLRHIPFYWRWGRWFGWNG